MELKKGTTFTANGISYQVTGFDNFKKAAILRVNLQSENPTTAKILKEDFQLLAEGKLTLEEAEQKLASQSTPAKSESPVTTEEKVEVEEDLKFRMSDNSAWTVTQLKGDSSIITEYFTNQKRQLSTTELQDLIDNKLVKIVQAF
jgi:hypothetical protein